jgi:hypothetical protein
VARHWLMVMAPLLRYSVSRDAYVLRFVGSEFGPVVRMDRRATKRRSHFDGVERRRAHAA